RLPEEFHADSRKPVAEDEGSGDEAGALQRPECVGEDGKNDEEEHPLQSRLVKLARMASERPSRRKDHCPWCIAQPAPQFAIDEIRYAAEEQSERNSGGDDVEHAQDRNAMAPGEEYH